MNQGTCLLGFWSHMSRSNPYQQGQANIWKDAADKRHENLRSRNAKALGGVFTGIQ